VHRAPMQIVMANAALCLLSASGEKGHGGFERVDSVDKIFASQA
jgi:hypothetical protein